VAGEKTSGDTTVDDQLPWLPGADRACFLCRAVAERQRRDRNLVVHGDDQTVVVLNRYPYNNGHLLVAPARHEGRLDQFSPDELAAHQRQIARFVQLLERLIGSEGFNVGLNLGRVAGAGVPGHLHWHIVPRWTGDTNFMPVLESVSVIAQSLDALWRSLTDEVARLEGRSGE
jgi:ATP adenylyltransferase